MLTGPTVSVVIPARNAERTIVRAISSTLDPARPPEEVIVADDGSTDDTAAVAESVAARGPVRVLRLGTSRGAAAARNAGIAAAKGALVAFQDADDEWLPGKLGKQIGVLQSDPRIVFATCKSRVIAPDGRDLGPLYDGQVPPAGASAWRALLARNTIATPSVVVWRRELEAVGGFNTSLRIAEDQDMWIRLSMRGHLGFVDEYLLNVHVTADSLSGVGTSRGVRDQLAFTIPMIQRHLAQRSGELSHQDVRRILGERLGRLGRSAYSFPDYGTGLTMVLRSTMLGYRPLENILFLASAAPPARWLKRQFGAERR
jgi:hypothetical protein